MVDPRSKKYNKQGKRSAFSTSSSRKSEVCFGAARVKRALCHGAGKLLVNAVHIQLFNEPLNSVSHVSARVSRAKRV